MCVGGGGGGGEQSTTLLYSIFLEHCMFLVKLVSMDLAFFCILIHLIENLFLGYCLELKETQKCRKYLDPWVLTVTSADRIHGIVLNEWF